MSAESRRQTPTPAQNVKLPLNFTGGVDPQHLPVYYSCVASCYWTSSAGRKKKICSLFSPYKAVLPEIIIFKFALFLLRVPHFSDSQTKAINASLRVTGHVPQRDCWFMAPGEQNGNRYMQGLSESSWEADERWREMSRQRAPRKALQINESAN